MLMAEPRAAAVAVLAPPGYGKTLLLAEWAEREDRPVSWLTIDDLDNDPSVFLSYLAVAVDRIEPIDPGVAAAIAVPGPRILATAVPRLAHELYRIRRPAVLVLDDVHRLTDRTCLDALRTLLDYLPPGFQVAMAGRAEPDLPLGRLRARRDLLEITREDLALDASETGSLTAAAGVRLTPDEARTLVARTEGWAAGIYLAVLARERSRSAGLATDEVSGRDGYIADYIRAELFAALPDDDIALLSRTSIFEVVEPSIAEAVVGSTATDERLRALALANPLIGRVSGPDAAYRYHNLLRDFLGAELERREPGTAAGLHLRASSEYRAAGRTELAVEHAMRSGDLDVAAELVGSVGLRTFYIGHGDRLDRWLRSLDDATFERHPPLAIMAAWVDVINGRPEAADRMADIAERSAFTGVPADGSASFESSRAMLRTLMARRGTEDALANALFATEAEDRDGPWRSEALWLLGGAHALTGDAVAADMALAHSVEAARRTGATATIPLSLRAGLAMARGDWRAADALARESRAALIARNLEETIAAPLGFAVSARAAIHRGDIGQARDDLVRAQITRPLGSYAAPWITVGALLELARAYLAISDPAGAQNVVAEAEAIVRRRPALGALAIDLVEMRRRLGEARQTLVGSSSLTGAELRLLPILSTHLTFQEVADRLGLSRHTVKTQAISIYGKLGASSRSEAVERAVRIGLLEPFPGLALGRGGSSD
jgi:LuxR family transcriptional regulator, maltose regulon positive regulatory protein